MTPVQLQFSMALIGLPISFKFAMKSLQLSRNFMAVGILVALIANGLTFALDLKNKESISNNRVELLLAVIAGQLGLILVEV